MTNPQSRSTDAVRSFSGYLEGEFKITSEMVNIAQILEGQHFYKGDHPDAAIGAGRGFKLLDSPPCQKRISTEDSEETLMTPRMMLAPEMSEAEAIEGAKQGNGECFEFLYSLHKRRVYSLCLRMTGNVEAAEDSTQDAFLQLYRKITSFRGESAFSTWLHRLTVNVVLMQLRKKGLPQVSLEEILAPTEEGSPKKEFGFEDQVLAGSIDRVILERIIESLSPGYRIIFVLHDIEGYEHNEIAEMLGCSVGNSKSQLHKARVKLREVLRISRGITRAENARSQKMKVQRAGRSASATAATA